MSIYFIDQLTIDLDLYKGKRILACDVGDISIGLSLSDPSWLISSPYMQIKRNGYSNDIKELCSIIQDQSVSLVLIGYPLEMDGRIGQQTQKVLDFTKILSEKIEQDVLLWDERFSTKAVMRTLIEADVSRKKRKTLKDQNAAAFFLQGFLDYVRYQKNSLES